MQEYVRLLIFIYPTDTQTRIHIGIHTRTLTLTHTHTHTHTHTYIYIYIYLPDIGLAVRVFANGPGDLGSIPGRVIPKTQKMVLDTSLLNTQHYKVRIKGKVEQSREGVAPSPTPWCSSYRKGSLRVTLDYGRPLYFFYLYIRTCGGRQLSSTYIFKPARNNTNPWHFSFFNSWFHYFVTKN